MIDYLRNFYSSRISSYMVFNNLHYKLFLLKMTSLIAGSSITIDSGPKAPKLIRVIAQKRSAKKASGFLLARVLRSRPSPIRPHPCMCCTLSIQYVAAGERVLICE